MLLPPLRSLLLFLFTACAFIVMGRAPGAVQLRTREIEAAIAAEGRAGRDRAFEHIWAGGAKPV
jgi:hypothetical protein